MNQFGDWSMEEYKRKMLPSYMKIEKPEPARLHKFKNVSVIPESVDWRTKGVVTPIKVRLALLPASRLHSRRTRASAAAAGLSPPPAPPRALRPLPPAIWCLSP